MSDDPVFERAKVVRDPYGVIALMQDFRERMGFQNLAFRQAQNPTSYEFVASRLFTFAFNTYTAISNLLAEYFYEQAAVIFRTLWETDLHFEWVSRDPDQRADRFVSYMAVEYLKLYRNRISIARLVGDQDGLLRSTQQLADFERRAAEDLAKFARNARPGQPPAYTTFTGKNTKDTAAELGDVWLDEYYGEYSLASMWIHGGPGAVLPPFGAADDFYSKIDPWRSGIIGAQAIRVMIRADEKWLAVTGRSDRQYLLGLLVRLAPTRTA